MFNWIMVVLLGFSAGIAKSAQDFSEFPDMQNLFGELGGVDNSRFGENFVGVHRRLAPSGAKHIALTLDLCDGGIDEAFVTFLQENKIKATLFVSGRWARINPQRLKALADDPLFVIANHGFHHRPVSSIPRSIYGIASTKNLQEVYYEVKRNETLIRSITGKSTKLFRAGTAYYDPRSIALIHALGYQVVGYDTLAGDAAYPNNKPAMVANLRRAGPGSIILMHLNHPNWQSKAAFVEAYRHYQKESFEFVHLKGFEI